ncbi:uncharacterized protein LOC126736319 [Anthonomus grandis grandis]|uniref:uncharacterized protein LOC126736319 n=1 Tax=Anthonomus grandis grandis TaxID=2921223 RepID=UPI00216699DF|nr:uncharacterized protein LOC126736319 [Anthonomus grandis grandis]
MVKQKSEDLSSKQAAEIQKLTERLEEMALKFDTQLKGFKKDLGARTRGKSTSTDFSEDIEAVVSLNKRFQDFEKSVLDSIENLKSDIASLKQTNTLCMSTNQNSILLHGINELQDDLYAFVIKTISTKIGVKITKAEINFAHRIGQKKANSEKPRPVLVSFCHRWLRDDVFFNKKRLKGQPILITEVLTPEVGKIFKIARNKYKNLCWTSRGRVFVMVENQKFCVDSEKKLQDLVNECVIAD